MKKRLDDNFFWCFVKHVGEFFHYYIGAFGCLIGLNYFQSEIPRLAQQMGELAGGNRLDELNLGYFLFLGFAILLFRTLSRLLFFYPARVQQKYLRNEFVWRLSQTPPKKYKDKSSGQIYQTLFNDLNRIRGFMGFALLQLGNIIVALFIFIPKVTEVNSQLLYAYIPFAVGMLIFTILIIFFAPYEKKGTDLQGDVQNFLVETYQGMGTLKNFNVEEPFIKKFSRASWLELQNFFIGSLGRVVSMPLVRLSMGASFLWGAYIVQSQDLGASTLIFFSGFLFLMLEPFMFISWIGVVATAAWAGWKRIKELIEVTELEDVSLRVELDKSFQASIELWNDPVNYEFHLGQKYVICGETGSGKTHFIEQVAAQMAEEKLIYAMVFQEPYVYNDTVENNLFLGQDVTADKKILAEKLLRVFFLDEILEIKDYWKMELGENGKRLSGGQAKRLILVRSLLSNANVLLWDDPFSSVDVIQEKQIFESLEKLELIKGKLLIFTAHRYSSAKASDEILLIGKEQGLIGSGESKEQLKLGTKIYEYFEKQFI